MTQEDKKLLLKDLCARLPYGVKCIVTKSRIEEGQKGDMGKLVCICLEGVNCISDIPFFSEFGNFKPYLFPLSSMTEEQCYKFYCGFVENETDYNDFKKYYFDGCLWSKVLTSINDCSDIIDWFNKNHFDYRDLIEKGLAIDATGLNIY